MIPFERIVFDCDSTLSAIEGVDQLPCSDRDAVARLTDEAMGGALPLEQVYGRRLELLQPTRSDVEALGPAYIQALVPGARLVVFALQSLGKEVRVLSGGLAAPVAHMAAHLGIPPDLVDAVVLEFNEDGSYRGLRDVQPLAHADGKSRVLAALPTARTALVGDGWTDCMAADTVDLFVGYGGVVVRPKVRDAATIYCDNPSLAAILPYVLTETELKQLEHDPRTAGMLPDISSMESST